MALEEQMKLFVDPVAETATVEIMVFELLLKSGKDLNSKIEHKAEYYCINGNELVFMLEKATQEIVNSVLKEHPQKVIALDRLYYLARRNLPLMSIYRTFLKKVNFWKTHH